MLLWVKIQSSLQIFLFIFVKYDPIFTIQKPIICQSFFFIPWNNSFFFSTPEIKMIQFPQNVAVCNVMKQTVNVHVLSTFCVIKAFDSGVILKTWIICILLVFLGRWIFFVFGQKWQVLHVNGSAVTELNRR